MLADTTLLIDFLRGKKEAIDIIAKANPLMLSTTEINVFELITGLHMSGKNIQPQLEKIMAMISRISVLPLDRKASLKSGEIAGKLAKAGKKLDETDCLIAGIALANGIKNIITENKAHFERISELNVITY